MRSLAQAAGLQAAESATIDFTQSIGRVQESANSAADLGRDVVGSVISDLRQGKDAAEAFADALDQVADRLINMALDAAFSTGQGGGGGILGALLGAFGGGALGAPGLGGIYADGGYTGPGGKYQPAGVVHKGEYVFDAEATKRIGPRNLEAMRRSVKGYASGGLVGPGDVAAARRMAVPPGGRSAPSFSLSTSIDARGSQMGEAQFKAILEQNNKHVLQQVATKVIPTYDRNRWRAA